MNRKRHVVLKPHLHTPVKKSSVDYDKMWLMLICDCFFFCYSENDYS